MDGRGMTSATSQGAQTVTVSKSMLSPGIKPLTVQQSHLGLGISPQVYYSYAMLIAQPQ